MRLRFLITACALAGSLGLAACSSGGSLATPGGARQTASMHGVQITAIGLQRQARCPVQFFVCVTISKNSPARVTLCINDASGHCPAPGSWFWKGQILTKRFRMHRHIIGNFSPNPGNPTDDTISETKPNHSSEGRYKYQQQINVCNSASSCRGFAIGIATR